MTTEQSNKLSSLILSSCLAALMLVAQPAIADSQINPLSNVPFGSIKDLAKSEPSQIISYGKDPLQYAELWQPQQPKPNAPAIVFIHGGCWLNAFDITHTHAASHALKQAGYVVWSLEYRRTGDKGGAWPGSYQDIIKGIEKAKQVLKQDLILMGHSAGGHLAILAGQHFHKQNQTSIKKVIGLAAISDIERYSQGKNSCQTATSKFMNGDYQSQTAQYDKANPMKQGFHPNTLLIHGSEDKIVPLAQSIDTEQKVKVIKKAGHFDMIHPKTRSWQAIIKSLKL